MGKEKLLLGFYLLGLIINLLLVLPGPAALPASGRGAGHYRDQGSGGRADRVNGPVPVKLSGRQRSANRWPGLLDHGHSDLFLPLKTCFPGVVVALLNVDAIFCAVGLVVEGKGRSCLRVPEFG